MKDAILKTMSKNDMVTYQDKDIEMARERLDYYYQEVSKLYDSELVAIDIASPEQLYALGDILNIIKTIKENI
jgi:hypothetical protein